MRQITGSGDVRSSICQSASLIDLRHSGALEIGVGVQLQDRPADGRQPARVIGRVVRRLFDHCRQRGRMAVIIVTLLLGGLAFAFWQEWQVFSAAYPLVADVLRFILFAAPVSLAAGYGYTGMVVLWRRYGEHKYIEADKVIALADAQRELLRSVCSA